MAALAYNGGNAQLRSIAAQLGVSSGQSSSDVPLAATLPSIWNIPYPRNPFFTEQEDVLTRLANALKAGQATALSQPQAVSGLSCGVEMVDDITLTVRRQAALPAHRLDSGVSLVLTALFIVLQ